MEISEIQYIPIKPKDGCYGFVSFILNQELYIGSVAIHSRLDGSIRLVWPTLNTRGIKHATVHPISKELGQGIEKIIYDYIKPLLPI